MLTRLRFKNFKAWKDSGDIRLAPITVLFGANSAGKTSIPQLLLMLKQTAESPDRQRALQLGDSRTLVDLGTYDDVVRAHDVGRPLEITLQWSLDSNLTVSNPLTQRQYTGDTIRFDCIFEADRRHQPYVSSLEYVLSNADTQVLDLGMRLREPSSSARRRRAEYDLESEQYELRRQQGRPWPLPQPSRFYGFPDEVTAHFQNTMFAADLVLKLEQFLKSIFYLGPLREYPRRLYLWSGEVPDHVGERGDRAVEAILAASDRRFNWKPKQKTKSLQTVVAERLKNMGLIREFRVKALAQHRKEYEVLVRTSSDLPQVKLTDVGFGVSQILPVIVECFYVPRRSIVIFEQPEIHLHPRVQADLADLFIDAVRVREGGVPRECQFIIESHSEHFLRRLQRRIAEDRLAPSEAALYFVHTEGAEARIEELSIDDFGNIRNWPLSFFGDEMGDLVARAEAQARRLNKGVGA